MKIRPTDIANLTPGDPRYKGSRKSEKWQRIEAAAEKIGMSPSGLYHRMCRYHLTLEEAMRWQPEDRSEIGRRGRKRSDWDTQSKIHWAEKEARDHGH